MEILSRSLLTIDAFLGLRRKSDYLTQVSGLIASIEGAVPPLYYAASLKLVIRPSTSAVLEYRIAGIRVCRLSRWMT